MITKVRIDPIKLKKARMRALLSQKEAADKLNIMKQQLCRIERGHQGLNGDFLARLCLLYGVEIKDVVTEAAEVQQPAA